MKKLFTTIAIILCLFCLCACEAKLPEDMTKEKVNESAEKIIETLNSKDYDTFNETSEQVLIDALANSPLSDAWEPFYFEAGSFEKIEKTTLQSSKGYAVAIVQAKYTNKSVVFTLSFNADYQLGGIYFK